MLPVISNLKRWPNFLKPLITLASSPLDTSYNKYVSLIASGHRMVNMEGSGG